MYETGPWQMSFLWAGSYNTNGNGSANVCDDHAGHQRRDAQHSSAAACRASTARTSTAIRSTAAVLR